MATASIQQPAEHVLDKPIWSALTGPHAHFAMGEGAARCYPQEVSPLAGIRDFSQASVEALSRIVRPGDTAALFVDDPHMTFSSAWSQFITLPLYQMVWQGGAVNADREGIVPLGDEDSEAMMELTELTKPGPFNKRTHHFGGYVGVRENGRLIAMAGERLHPPGYTEVSAVCTHPDHRGRGLAKKLMLAVMEPIQKRGDVPFLHVAAANTGAIRLYEAMGYVIRKQFQLFVLKRN